MDVPEPSVTRSRLQRYADELAEVEAQAGDQLDPVERRELHVVLHKIRMVLDGGEVSELDATLRYVRRWRRGFVKRLRARQDGTLDELRYA